MSKIVFYAPGNLCGHSNVDAKKRWRLLEEFEGWLEVMRNAPVPVAMSLQGMDMDIAGMECPNRSGVDENVTWLSAPVGHLLMSLYATVPSMAHYVRTAINGGVVTEAGYFCPEFDVPRLGTLPEGALVPFLPGNSVMYSECGAEPRSVVQAKAIRESWLSHESVEYQGKVLVPMDASDMQKAFFAWQRFPHDKDLRDNLAQAIVQASQKDTSQYQVLFIDLEAPLVGSNFGLEAWRMFFQLIEEYSLRDLFAGWSEASSYWRSSAFHLSQEPMIARDLGQKWTWAHQQILLTDGAKLAWLNANRDPAFIRLMAVASTSDALSALDRKLRGDVYLDADGGQVCIGHDPTIIALAELATIAMMRGSVEYFDEGTNNFPQGPARQYAQRVARWVTGS
ncbi:hypothetical protein KJ766_03235 [Patescibacteria group bacterium]|nr:hypothetical protein [Patescibacteria group bacterium]